MSQLRYDVVDDIGNQRTNIMMDQLIVLNPSLRKNLRRDLNSKKSKKKKSKRKIFIVNIGVKVVDVQVIEMCTNVSNIKTCLNGHFVENVLVDIEFVVNIISEHLMKKLRMILTHHTKIIIKMANKQKVKTLGVLEMMVISMVRVQILMSFQVLTESSYDLLLDRS